MVPDIDIVREKFRKNVARHGNAAVEVPYTLIAIDHFYNEVESQINDQLLKGHPAKCNLTYWDVRGYMMNNFKFNEDADAFTVINAVFERIKINYTCVGYTVLVEEHMGSKSNYNAFYASYYSCVVTV